MSSWGFCPLLENLEREKACLDALIKSEFHPKRIHDLLDKLENINSKIRNEKRKYVPEW